MKSGIVCYTILNGRMLPMLMRVILSALVVSAFLPIPGSAQEAVPPLFASHETLELRIEANFDKIHKERKDKAKSYPATLRVEGPDGAEQELGLKIKTRGLFRLKRSTCKDPPLRLDFPKTKLEGTIFEGQNKLKLVTHCRDNDSYEQNALEEYLIYRTFNLLTDSSFRVRLVRITYVDSRGKDDDKVRYGFLIEDEDVLAKRLDGFIVKSKQAHPSLLSDEDAALVAVFQYMIGNTDFSVVFFHNIKIVQTASGSYLPIPYDYDWAGLVGAPYAKPNSRLGTRSVRDRVYMGYCRPAMDFALIYQRFQQNHEAILDLFANQEGLSEDNRKRAARYLGEFFETLEDPSKAAWKIVGRCLSV